MPTDTLDAFIAMLPKVELHLHLETSLRLRRLAERAGEGPALGAPHLVADPAVFVGYDRLRRLRYAGRVGRVPDAWYTRERIAAITAELLREAAAQGVRHVEVRVGGRRGFTLLGVRGMLEAMAEGAASVRGLGIGYGAIVTVVRERGPDDAARLVAEAVACRDCGVVGIDLAGDEQNFPPALFAAALRPARDAGLGLAVHAGEFAGPAGIWTALYHLGADRVGHGIRAVEDPALVDHLRDRSVTLEVCPTSNVRLGLVPSLAQHPVGMLRRAGVAVTINSDDPLLLGTTLTRELAAVARAHRLTPADLVELQATAARAAFAPDAVRRALDAAVRAAPLPAAGGSPAP
ncbi:MAG: adenosine deaminase [Armatimonadota bacterium]|nr:adenosine deaminase [Armatimonadota bacterium]MDR7533432.1 adenosine deaminase [Armatimonadota bacterium]MDR7536246.1 adenosine deaminase [Armatimonadota bacterium]